ncbi:MAG: SDR family NAD(P)-dependent oxidoreductase [Thermostichales cyanobacterium SZTDM-1c_bins_54]
MKEAVVIITGGSAGIGAATARRCAQQGSRLVLLARQGEPLRQLALELERQYNSEVMTLAMDTRDPEACGGMAEQVRARFGQVDVLVNNAGYCLTGSFQDTSLEQWQQLFATNLMGYVHMIRAVLPLMQARQRGVIINVGSIGGKVPLPLMSAYCASKFAVSGLTAALRWELAPQIQVSVVHPGVVRSDFLQRAEFAGDPERQAELRQRLQSSLSSWLATDPETVAEAIYQAILTNPGEVVVGWAAAVDKAYQLFPEGVGSLLRG